MAKATNKLIQILRKTANRLEHNENYNWKSIGNCNCGNMIQEITGLEPKAISTFGIQKHGDWQSISKLYDPSSNLEIDGIISTALLLGLDIEDFTEIENLSNKEVCKKLRVTHLVRDNKQHAIMYFNTWANILENNLLKNNKKYDKIFETVIL